MTSVRARRAVKQTKRRVYKNPPISEAVCEFQFSNPDDWNIACSGLLYERVKKRYNGKPREQRLLRIEGPPATPQQDNAQRVMEITKVQFPSADGREILAVGPGILSVHSLKPYSGWERFRSQIHEAFRANRKVAAPKGVRRIGLRYINQIFIPHDLGTPDDFFSAPPHHLGTLPCIVDAFNLRHEYSFTDAPMKAVVTFASLNSPPNTHGCVLDIDLTRTWTGEPCKLDDALKVLDEVRQKERGVFESLITDKARGLFDA